MSLTLRKRLFAAILLLPLVALATETSGMGLRCRLTGVVLDACCCGSDSGQAIRQEVVASVSPAQCCDRVSHDVARAPVELTAQLRPLSDPPAVAVVAVVELWSADPAASPIVPRADVRQSLGPPTLRSRLVAKSSFLI